MKHTFHCLPLEARDREREVKRENLEKTQIDRTRLRCRCFFLFTNSFGHQKWMMARRMPWQRKTREAHPHAVWEGSRLPRREAPQQHAQTSVNTKIWRFIRRDLMDLGFAAFFAGLLAWCVTSAECDRNWLTRIAWYCMFSFVAICC